MHDKKRYASINNPTIQAVVSGMYRFSSEGDAQEQLGTLKKHFICAKKQIANPESPSLILWIKGFELENDDTKHGVIGHFAIVTYQKHDGHYQLVANKMEEDYRKHPQRAQVKRDNPNWGHPVIRSIRKNQTYNTLEAAQEQLNQLHVEFPKVTIPNPGKLYIMIYCADRPARNRMVKHILEIQTNKEGVFYIECRENTSKPKKKPKQPATQAAEKPDDAPLGSFTSNVALRRQKKGRPILTPKKSDSE